MLSRLLFIDLSNGDYVTGMDYYSKDLSFEDPEQINSQLLNEIKEIHPVDIIHRDIKLEKNQY